MGRRLDKKTKETEETERLLFAAIEKKLELSEKGMKCRQVRLLHMLCSLLFLAWQPSALGGGLLSFRTGESAHAGEWTVLRMGEGPVPIWHWRWFSCCLLRKHGVPRQKLLHRNFLCLCGIARDKCYEEFLLRAWKEKQMDRHKPNAFLLELMCKCIWPSVFSSIFRFSIIFYLHIIADINCPSSCA